jgi:hypothetical protein
MTNKKIIFTIILSGTLCTHRAQGAWFGWGEPSANDQQLAAAVNAGDYVAAAEALRTGADANATIGEQSIFTRAFDLAIRRDPSTNKIIGVDERLARIVYLLAQHYGNMDQLNRHIGATYFARPHGDVFKHQTAQNVFFGYLNTVKTYAHKR